MIKKTVLLFTTVSVLSWPSSASAEEGDDSLLMEGTVGTKQLTLQSIKETGLPIGGLQQTLDFYAAHGIVRAPSILAGSGVSFVHEDGSVLTPEENFIIDQISQFHGVFYNSAYGSSGGAEALANKDGAILTTKNFDKYLTGNYNQAGSVLSKDQLVSLIKNEEQAIDYKFYATMVQGQQFYSLESLALNLGNGSDNTPLTPVITMSPEQMEDAYKSDEYMEQQIEASESYNYKMNYALNRNVDKEAMNSYLSSSSSGGSYSFNGQASGYNGWIIMGN